MGRDKALLLTALHKQRAIDEIAKIAEIEAEIAAIVEATEPPEPPPEPDPPPPQPDPPPPPPDSGPVIKLSMREFDASGVPAGSTIWLEAGERERLKIRNVNGAGGRINIRNKGGLVEIFSEERGKTAITLVDCNDFRFLGDGSEHPHGIKIGGTNRGFGLRTVGACTRYSIGRIEATEVSQFQVFMINAIAKCDNIKWGRTWKVEDVELFDLLAHDNTDEPIYAGSSYALPGKKATCDGAEVTRVDPTIDGLIIRGCLFERNEQDGLQIMGATNVFIYNNIIRQYGLGKDPSNDAGLRLGKYVSGKVHDNEIEYGAGAGIKVNHLCGKLHVYRNKAKRAGYLSDGERVRDSFGIEVYTPDWNPWKPFIDETAAANLLIEKNTVSHSARKAFRWNSVAGEENRIVDNVVVEDVPQMKDDDPAMISIKSGSSDLTFKGNKHERAG